MTPETEQKSLNLHDETTACDQVQHSLFIAVVGKLQYITGVRPDLMFATKCVNSTPHTSHFLVDSHLMKRTCVAQVQVWRAQRTFHIIPCVISMRSCCVFDSPRLSLPLLAVYLLSYRLVHLPCLQLLLPGCGGQISCALQLMRTLAPLPSTTLSQVMSPTTTTSRRPRTVHRGILRRGQVRELA